MVVDQPQACLASIKKKAGTYFIDHPGCAGSVLVNGIDRRIREDISATPGIVQLPAYISSCLGTVIMVQYTLNIDPLADCRAFF